MNASEKNSRNDYRSMSEDREEKDNKDVKNLRITDAIDASNQHAIVWTKKNQQGQIRKYFNCRQRLAG